MNIEATPTGETVTDANSAEGHRLRQQKLRALLSRASPKAQQNPDALTLSREGSPPRYGGRPPHHRKAATYESFKAFVHHIKRLGWVEPTGRVEEVTSKQLTHGQWQRQPKRLKVFYRLTAEGQTHGEDDWANAKSFTRTVFAPLLTSEEPEKAITIARLVRKTEIDAIVNKVEHDNVMQLEQIKELIVGSDEARQTLESLWTGLNNRYNEILDLRERASDDQRLVLEDLMGKIENSYPSIQHALQLVAARRIDWEGVQMDIQDAADALKSRKQLEGEELEF